jgi:putative sigma-54 modulation protein
MNLNLSGHHLEVTPAIREYVTAKLDRVKRRFDHVIEVNVILSLEREQRRAEASLHVRGKDLFAESENPDMYAAIDSLVDKLDRQIVKHKEKRSGARSNGGSKQQPEEG